MARIMTFKQFETLVKFAPRRMTHAAEEVGEALAKGALEESQEAFLAGGFDGQKWAPRTSKRRTSHPILLETWSMANSLKWKKMSKGRNLHYRVWSEKSSLAGAKRRKGRDFYYPMVHQYGASKGFRFYGRSNVPVVQREFMGFTKYQEYLMKEGEKIIFHEVFDKIM